VRVLGLAESATAAVGEEPVVADTDEALRQDVQQEAAGELTEWESEGPRAATAVVLVAEGDGLVIDVK